MMAVNFFGEGMLAEVRWEKIDGRVGGVARFRLEQRKCPVQRASCDFRFEEFVDNWPSLRGGGNKRGGTVLDR